MAFPVRFDIRHLDKITKKTDIFGEEAFNMKYTCG